MSLSKTKYAKVSKTRTPCSLYSCRKDNFEKLLSRCIDFNQESTETKSHVLVMSQKQVTPNKVIVVAPIA